MVDWRLLAFSGLWVLGAALALAAFSHAAWAASQRSHKLPQTLGERGYRLAFGLAGVVFCGGLAGLSPTAWQVGAWIGLALAFGVWLVWEQFRFHKHS